MDNSSEARRRATPPTAYLRVFEPLRAFSDDDQLLIRAQKDLSREQVEGAETDESLTRFTRTLSDPFPHSTHEVFRVLHYPRADGLTTPYYCPSQLASRAVLAAEQLEGSMRRQVLDLLLPDAAREANAARIDPDRFAEDVAHLHTRGATWGVPFGWFVLLHEEDHREIVEDASDLLGVRISAPIGQALERARYAAATLAIHAPQMDLLDELTALSEWLGLFSEDSIVELDYGRIAPLVWPDDSPHDLRMGLESLAESDMLGAAAAYRRLASRWLRIRQLARAS